jgi:hypothetical protein
MRPIPAMIVDACGRLPRWRSPKDLARQALYRAGVSLQRRAYPCCMRPRASRSSPIMWLALAAASAGASSPTSPTIRRTAAWGLESCSTRRPSRGEVLTGIQCSSAGSADVASRSRAGAQQLTSAIPPYCTLVQVRALDRGVGRSPSSVLILDNPTGRGSRAWLVEFQCEVTRAMRLQLVYTAGVNDFEVPCVLPKVLRLPTSQPPATLGCSSWSPRRRWAARG